MRQRLIYGVAALALAAPVIMAASAPASAQRWHGHRGFGWGPAAIAGAVVGAATAPLWAPGYYGYGYGYNPGYAYDPGYAPDYAYAPGYDDDYAPGYSGYGYGAPVPSAGPAYASARDPGWCSARYRSYDPASGTYLGYDGVRHSCP